MTEFKGDSDHQDWFMSIPLKRWNGGGVRGGRDVKRVIEKARAVQKAMDVFHQKVVKPEAKALTRLARADEDMLANCLEGMCLQAEDVHEEDMRRICQLEDELEVALEEPTPEQITNWCQAMAGHVVARLLSKWEVVDENGEMPLTKQVVDTIYWALRERVTEVRRAK